MTSLSNYCENMVSRFSTEAELTQFLEEPQIKAVIDEEASEYLIDYWLTEVATEIAALKSLSLEENK